MRAGGANLSALLVYTHSLAKYRFIKSRCFPTYVNRESTNPYKRVCFAVGDVIEGTTTTNPVSDPPVIIETETYWGIAKIGYGGKVKANQDVIEPISDSLTDAISKSSRSIGQAIQDGWNAILKFFGIA